MKTGESLTIDREKWKGCEMCHTCGNCEHNMGYECSQEMEMGKPNCGKFVPASNYCWKCGRPLTEDTWAELEKRIGHRMKEGQTMEVKKFKVILRG